MRLGNRLLAYLPKKDFALLEPHLKSVTFTRGERLIEAKELFHQVRFMRSGAISYVTPMEDGTAVESLSVGREGAVGLLASVGPRFSLSRVVVQISGEALALDANAMRKAFGKSPAIRDMVMRYTTLHLAHTMQLAACNARHTTEARLARWLLMCCDRIDGRRLEFKHEYLAETLGLQRPTVTLAARAMQSAGLILYRRGRIQILDIDGLKEVSCECYKALSARVNQLLPLARTRHN